LGSSLVLNLGNFSVFDSSTGYSLRDGYTGLDSSTELNGPLNLGKFSVLDSGVL